MVDFRTKNGNFKKVEEIMKVQGIGEKVFEEIKDLITVGGESAPK
ncbi:MAG: helix-hairpin-helix domain-containing protein [Candidatus Moduliflexus flocculans]|nr:helix-hairpin-helix domain-containing protein [Candidatus Moduliflexus flocculans]